MSLSTVWACDLMVDDSCALLQLQATKPAAIQGVYRYVSLLSTCITLSHGFGTRFLHNCTLCFIDLILTHVLMYQAVSALLSAAICASDVFTNALQHGHSNSHLKLNGCPVVSAECLLAPYSSRTFTSLLNKSLRPTFCSTSHLHALLSLLCVTIGRALCHSISILQSMRLPFVAARRLLSSLNILF